MSDITRTVKKQAPTYLRKLVDRLGQRRAAERLGMSPTGISKALEGSEVRYTVELAARYIWERETKDRAADELIIAKVPADVDRAMLFRFFEAFGIKYSRFTD